MHFKGAVFDLDGTLWDSMQLWKNIDIEFLAKRGITYSTDYTVAIAGLGFEDVAKYTIRRFNLPQTPGQVMDEWYNMAKEGYAHSVKLKPGAREYLDYLKAKGVRLCVATSLDNSLSIPCLKANKIYDYFEFFEQAADYDGGKSNPEIFKNCAKKLGLAPGETVLFEDVLPSVKAAKSAGLLVVAMQETLSLSQADEIKKTADMYIDSFAAAPKIDRSDI